MDLSQCRLETLHQDGEFILYGGLRWPNEKRDGARGMAMA